MRLDKYLKVSRLIKRRTVANEACDSERVRVNGRAAKASYEVKAGDVIGGMGTTSVLEASDIAHVHISVMWDGKYIDPESLLPPPAN